MSTGHLWIVGLILLVVLVIWGPGKLPDVGAGMGRAIREFRRATSDHPDPTPPPPPAAPPVAQATTPPVQNTAQPAAPPASGTSDPSAAPEEHRVSS